MIKLVGIEMWNELMTVNILMGMVGMKVKENGENGYEENIGWPCTHEE